MLSKTIWLIIISLILVSESSAQAINNAYAFRNISSESYFRFSYDNDFFSATDEYYTQGIDAELVIPQVKQFITSRLLLHPVYSYTRYGVGVQHNGFTPSSISSDDILDKDRPFAAVLVFKTFVTAVDPVKKQRFATSAFAGVVGQAAGAKEMQEFIHRGLGNITPHGWQYQINNDFALGYRVNYEKQVLAYRRNFSLSVSGGLELGTLKSNATVGTTLLAGHFYSPFGNYKSQRKSLQMYVYLRPEFTAVGYDATLQGGLTDRRSPYTIPDGSLSRIVFRNRLGFCLSYRRVFLEYFQAVVTPEFETSHSHGYGGIQVAFGI